MATKVLRARATFRGTLRLAAAIVAALTIVELLASLNTHFTTVRSHGPPVPKRPSCERGPLTESRQLSPYSQREQFCPPLPVDFPVNASFFPCDWDVKNVICKCRLKGSLVCNETSSAMLFEQVPSGTPPDRVPFHDECLDRVIRTRCRDDEFRVPRILHYVTLNEKDFPLYWFVSVLSAVRFLRPCLVLFHGDYLPVGDHWEALLQLVPQVLHVTRAQPTSIFGHPVNSVHHRTDVIRLQALQSDLHDIIIYNCPLSFFCSLLVLSSLLLLLLLLFFFFYFVIFCLALLPICHKMITLFFLLLEIGFFLYGPFLFSFFVRRC